MHVVPTTDLESERFTKNKTTAPAQITQSARLPWVARRAMPFATDIVLP